MASEEAPKARFAMPKVALNNTGWGPTQAPAKFANVPYAPFNKSDRLGRVADITGHLGNKLWRRFDRGGESNLELAYRHDAMEEDDFKLVDTVKAQRRPDFRRKNIRRRVQNATTEETQTKKNGRHTTGQSSFNRRYDRLTKARYQSRRRIDWRNKITRESSVKIEAGWDVLEQTDFSELNKLSTTPPKPTDIKWCGMVEVFDDGFDRISTKASLKLRRFEDKEFFFVTARSDPVLAELAGEAAGNVFVTDSVLCHLMTASRTVYPWDIVVSFVGGAIFMDVRDGPAFGLHTVNETANEPPPEESKEDINSKFCLSREATAIYQNFTQHCLKRHSKRRPDAAGAGAGAGAGAATPAAPVKAAAGGYEDHPFWLPEESSYSEPASVCYRYRKWEMDKDTTVVCRHTINAVSRKKGREQLLSVFTLNEYELRNTAWRKRVDSQRGAVLATELKNNGAKLAAWTAQALLADTNVMKIGYVSREHDHDPHNHVILGTQSQKPVDFARQANLDQKNMWGVVKFIIDKVRSHAEALRGDTPLDEFACKFLVIKDANRPILRMHAIRDFSTFESDDEEEWEEGEEQ